MAAPVADSYSCASGGTIAAGRSTVRPYLVGYGHSMIANSELVLSWDWVGMVGASAHKWLNTFLRMPFDYIKCDVDMPLAINMVNGFYGNSGANSATLNSGADGFVSAVTPLVASRPVVVGFMGCENDLTGGWTGATSWSNYGLILDKFSAAGWKTILSTSVPTTSYNTAGERDQVTAFSALLNGALPDSRILRVLDWTAPYQDLTEPNGYQIPLAGYTTDGIHLAQKGAYKLALDSYPSLVGLYSPWSAKAGDVICSQNPTLAGSAGALGSGASGVVPTGFTLQASGASVVGSRVDDYYQMVFNYSGGAYSAGALHGLIADVFSANVTAGVTTIQNICDVEIVECTNYVFQAQNILDASHVGEIPAIVAGSTDNWMDAIEGKRIVLHTEPHTYPATATRSMTSFGARVVYGSTTASLTVRLRWMGTKQA